MAVPAVLAAAVGWVLSSGGSGVVGNRADAGLMRLVRGPDPDFVDRITRLASGAADVRVDRTAFSEWLGDQQTFDVLSRLAARPEASGNAGLHEFAGEYASELLATAEKFRVIADGQSASAQDKVAELIACTLVALWAESDPAQRPLFVLLGDTTALRQGQEQLRDLVEKLVETVKSGTADTETRNYRDEMDALLSRLECIGDGIQNLLAQSETAHDPRVGSTAAGVEQPSFAVKHIPFTSAVGQVLHAASARAQFNGRRFLTTDVLLAVLDLPDSAVEKCFDRFSPGLADQVQLRLRNALETATNSPDYPKWQPFNFDLRPEVLRARELAAEGRDPEVTELHLLLGILDNERSRTQQELAALLSPEGLNRLRSITVRMLAEPVTPGSKTEN